MKISRIKTYKFSVPTGQNIRDPHTGQLISSTSKPWLFLKVETDAGIVGWGEGSGEWLAKLMPFQVNTDTLKSPRKRFKLPYQLQFCESFYTIIFRKPHKL